MRKSTTNWKSLQIPLVLEVLVKRLSEMKKFLYSSFVTEIQISLPPVLHISAIFPYRLTSRESEARPHNMRRAFLCPYLVANFATCCNKYQLTFCHPRAHAHTRPTMLRSVKYLCTMFGAKPINHYICSDIRKDSRRGWCCVGEAIGCQSSTEIGRMAVGCATSARPLPLSSII